MLDAWSFVRYSLRTIPLTVYSLFLTSCRTPSELIISCSTSWAVGSLRVTTFTLLYSHSCLFYLMRSRPNFVIIYANTCAEGLPPLFAYAMISSCLLISGSCAGPWPIRFRPTIGILWTTGLSFLSMSICVSCGYLMAHSAALSISEIKEL